MIYNLFACRLAAKGGFNLESPRKGGDADVQDYYSCGYHYDDNPLDVDEHGRLSSDQHSDQILISLKSQLHMRG